MADKAFIAEIVTPKRVVFSGEVTSFSAPGVVGGFQVLKNHAPLLSSIAVGEVKLVDIAGMESHYATSGGVVEVHDNKVIMLAETAERSDEIDVDRARAARDRARQRLAEKKSEVDFDRARIALFRALNRLKVANQL
jgi:F-type H+-transporting ATPase subunit epsilon